MAPVVRLLARKFQHLTEEHQYRDHGRGFEVDRHRSMLKPK